jgi:amino acid transporter
MPSRGADAGAGSKGSSGRSQQTPPDLFAEPEVTPPAPPRRSLKKILFGAPKNPLDPRVFHHISLIALFAWVGLGADGLSSSSYGPEEAFLALGDHRHLALYLAVATAFTVAIISASYMQIIHLFPHGGGGYVVSTKLLGAGAGLVAGSALVIDYVLTISISVASAFDALFSFLPKDLHALKLPIVCGIIFILTWMNLRGVKESVKILFPIFMLFLITHAALLGFGIFARADVMPVVLSHTVAETTDAFQTGTLGVVILLLIRAYCIGGGTYTGIEAVSNGIAMLREPRERTGRNTMIAMAISLAVTASGLLICYLLYNVQHEPGKTLNASLAEVVSQRWMLFGHPISAPFVVATLLAEGGLLFVASQAGFIDGPRVLASMAVDGWVPRRFAYLSDRLVTQDGVGFMGILSILMILVTGGNVRMLVILHSVNVFLVFSLSQLGMIRHWWQVRGAGNRWRGKLTINAIGLALTATVFVFNLVFKFTHGAWVTALLTGGLVLACVRVRKHYAGVRGHLKELDATLTNLPPALLHPPREMAVHKGAAIILVGGYGGLGVHTLLNVVRLFGALHDRYVFVCVGEIDSSKFKGRDEVDALRASTEEHLGKYLRLARNLGLNAESRMSLATDPIPELEKMCLAVGREYPRSVVYAGQLLFQEEGSLSRLLHNQAAFALQRRLIFQGLQMMILPIRVWETKKKAPAKGAGAPPSTPPPSSATRAVTDSTPGIARPPKGGAS